MKSGYARFPHTRDTLLAQPADCGSGCEAAIPAPDAPQCRVMASHPNPLMKPLAIRLGHQKAIAKSLVIPQAGEGANGSLRELHINQPLAGLRIVVTRPREQAAQLAQHIEQAGGIPLLFPLLDIAAVQDSQTLHEQISRLAQFNLAVFISPNAVQYGMAAVRAAGALPPTLKIATIGQGSAKALRELGVANIISPTERFDSEGLLALPELQNVTGWRVMIFRGDGGRELLGDTLKARGATVEYATCYQRSKTQLDVSMLTASAPDAITITSSEALKYLWQMLGETVRTMLRDTPLFVPHGRIAELAHQQGWRYVRLTDAGDDGLLSALIAWAGQKTEDRGQKAGFCVPPCGTAQI